MPLPSATTENFPAGLDTITIAGRQYIVDYIDLPSDTTRQIIRIDHHGDYAESQTRIADEPITGIMILQRATTNTPRPPTGTRFTYDYDRRGTNSTLEVTDVKTPRSKTEADVFEIGVKLIN